jgi:flagellar motor switch protein FliM
MSSLQRSVVDCNVAFIDQTTYAEFIMSLSNPSCSYTFRIDPLGGPAIIDFSVPITNAFIDRQFGGKINGAQRENNPLTAIERDVMSKVITRTLADLEGTWSPLLRIQTLEAELETNSEFMQVAAPSDTVILIAFEVNMAHASGLVQVCYPYFTLEPVMAYLNVQTWASRERGKRDSEKKQRLETPERVTTDVRAVLAQGRIKLQDLAAIKQGDVIALDSPANSPTAVFVGDRPKFLGKPVQSGQKLAVQVTGDRQSGRSQIHVTRTEDEDRATLTSGSIKWQIINRLTLRSRRWERMDRNQTEHRGALISGRT